jgi:PAS domain S-box-containing protein
MVENRQLILCVDDNEGARYALVRTLQRAGFRTVEAATGHGALDEARGVQPDLIVLDVQLPDINGYEVCQRLKHDPQTSPIPVLQISADFIDVEHRARGLELGADAYLAHPIEPPELIATVRSLLRARQAEDQARRVARELQSTFDAVADAICLLDRDGRIVRCNQAMARFETNGAPLEGRDLTSFLPAAAAGAEEDPFRRMVESRRRAEQEIQHGNRWLRVTCDPVLDERGQLTGAVCVFSDFTERKRAQEEREQLLAREQEARAQTQDALGNVLQLQSQLREKVLQLQAADQRKDEFLAMLAHELRNPLAAITTGLHALDVEGFAKARGERTRAIIMRQVSVLTRLVDDLLDVSRITRGKVELRKTTVGAREALENAVAVAKPLIADRRHQLHLELPSEPLRVLGDPTRLEQIFSNLLNNAAKYTEPGGTIDARLSRDEQDVVLRVRDSGIGIAPEMLDRVFELFTQVDQSPARTGGGLGVGLTLVRQLVEMHGGSVRARSEGLGCGSEFEVRLPLLVEPGASADESPVKQAPGARRILLVEDNPDIGETLRDLLELLGHDVVLAADGLHGVERALSLKPEVALVDIGLPGIDGYEVARRLRESFANGEMLLVALTGYGRPEDRDRAREAGFDAHLVKPVDPDELVRLFTQLGRGVQVSGEA